MDLNIKRNFSLLDRMAPHQRSSQQASSDEARGFGELKSVLMKEVQTEFGDSKFHNINYRVSQTGIPDNDTTNLVIR